MYLDPTYKIVSESDDMYSHESQILIKNIGGIDYLFMAYIYNKTTNIEFQLNAKAVLRIFNLATGVHIRTMEMFYAGLTAGITMPADEGVFPIRMYFIGDDLKCFIASESTLFTRTIDISNTNPNNWSVGDLSIVQMTMKDAGGNDVLTDVTSANLNIHFDYVFGDDYAGYHNLMPLFRNMDIATDGDNWYATMECSGEKSHGLGGITVVLFSTDAGVSWRIGNPIGYSVASRNKVIEPSIIFKDSNLHVVARSTGPLVWHWQSIDGGDTWTQAANITLDGIIPSKPCAINYMDGATLKNVIAMQAASKVAGNTGRTTLFIGSTDDFLTFDKTLEIVTPTYAHYPSMCYYNGHLYISYTKGDGTTDRNWIVFAEIV